jgi:hypothetical protein
VVEQSAEAEALEKVLGQADGAFGTEQRDPCIPNTGHFIHGDLQEESGDHAGTGQKHGTQGGSADKKKQDRGEDEGIDDGSRLHEGQGHGECGEGPEDESGRGTHGQIEHGA